MTQKASLFLRVIIPGLVVVIMASVAYLVIRRAEQSRAELPILGQLPPFNFVKQTGGSFGLDNLRGKINVVDFIFTRCMGPCPIMSGHMAELYQLYRASDKIRFVSISVDPDYDSLPVLSDYSREYGVNDNRWVFLRSTIDEVKLLSEHGFMLVADDLPAMHSTKFVLVDQNARIRGYYSGTEKASVNILKTHINRLVKQVP